MTNSSVSATTSTMISEMTERMIFLRVSGVAPGLSQAMVRSRPRAMRRARSTLVIIDEDGVYDPASPNDRLLLGMKGTMSEMELSVFRQRSIEAMKQTIRQVLVWLRQEKIPLPVLTVGDAA